MRRPLTRSKSDFNEETLKKVALIVPQKEVSPRSLPGLDGLYHEPPAEAVPPHGPVSRPAERSGG